jgi:hypothetical protein
MHDYIKSNLPLSFTHTWLTNFKMRNREHEYNDENIMQICSDQEFVYHFADSGTAENKL